MKKYTLSLALLFFFISCQKEKLFLPKPRSYPKIEFPQKTYQDFSQEFCPFGFNFPSYGEIVKDELFFEEKTTSPLLVRSRHSFIER